MAARGVKLVGKRLQMQNLGAVELQSLPATAEAGAAALTGGNVAANPVLYVAATSNSPAIRATSSGSGAGGDFYNSGGGNALSANSNGGTGVAAAFTAAAAKSQLRLVPGGAALPTNPAEGEIFTDAGSRIWNYENGKWASLQGLIPISLNLIYSIGSPITPIIGGNLALGDTTDFNIRIRLISFAFLVNSTFDLSNQYQVGIYSYAMGGSTGVQIGSNINLWYSGATAGTFSKLIYPFDNNISNPAFLALQVVGKSGNPGTLQNYAATIWVQHTS